MIRKINSETKMCISLASRQGNFGNTFHNYFYKKMNLNFIYKSFSTNDLKHALLGVRALSIRGCSLSMPFKVAAVQYLDDVHTLAKSIGAVNSIVNEDGLLKGFNTDYVAVKESFEKYSLPKDAKICVYGSGGMARAVAHALSDLGYTHCTIVARNEATGRALAERYGYEWKKDFEKGEWFVVLINATPVGMLGGGVTEAASACPFTDFQISKSKLVCDVVNNPNGTRLQERAIALNKDFIGGFSLSLIQAREQFRLYTGLQLEGNLEEPFILS